MGPTDHIADSWLRALYDTVYLTPDRVYHDARQALDSGTATDRLAAMRVAAKAVDAILSDLDEHGDEHLALYTPPERPFWEGALAWLDVRIEGELTAGAADMVWQQYDALNATESDAAVDEFLREMDDDAARVRELVERLNSLIPDSHGFQDALVDARGLAIITTPVTGAIARAANNSIRQAAMAGRMADGCPILRELLLFERLSQLEPDLLETLASNALVPALAERDRALIDGVLALVPDEIGNPTLAYNIACTWAVVEDRERLIPAAAAARSLGKPREQFLADADFAAFTNEAEFLAAIE